ncbi:MAG: hypothetical protein HY763_12195 [Planctomycetes bacterium]|nr:hypothetical protein [Planctomycetota bacterium]
MITPPELTPLVESLRREAADARMCLRTLLAQVIAFAVAAISATLIAGERAPDAAFAVVGVLGVVIAVQRIGLHKFSTTNRLWGYQLHLERLRGTPPHPLSLIGWEEACRAWRIVQATVFEAIYTTPRSRLARLPTITDLYPGFFVLRQPFRERLAGYDKYRRELRALSLAIDKIHRTIDEHPHGEVGDNGSRLQRDCSDLESRRQHLEGRLIETSCLWWMPGVRAALGGGCYHAGSYLARIFAILGALQLFSLLPLLILFLRQYVEGPLGMRGWAAGVCTSLGLMVWALNWLSLRRRRKILEEELLSIHSCAIMWKAVALAHSRAWGATVNSERRRSYTERLARIACWYARAPLLIREISDLDDLPEEVAERSPGRDLAEPEIRDVFFSATTWKGGFCD